MTPSLCLSLLAAFGSPAEPAPKESRDPLCGAYCLYVSLRSLDCEVASYAEVAQRLGPPPRGGYSMAQLAEVARTYGARTLGVLTSIENLAQREPPVACIALLDQSHYVIISDIGEGPVRIIDPPREYVLDRNTFSYLWTGEALLIAKKPLPAEETITKRGSWSVVYWLPLAVLGGLAIIWLFRSAGHKARSIQAGLIAMIMCGCADQQTSPETTALPRSDLVWATREFDLGTVQVSNQPTDAVFGVRNVGTATARLKRIDLSCRCASADWSNEFIEAGEQERITLQIRTNQAGKHTATATVICENAETAPPRLTVRWNAVAPVEIRPAQIDFGDVLPGSIHHRTLSIVNHSTVPCPLVELRSSHARQFIAAVGDTPADESGSLPDELEVTLHVDDDARGKDAGTVTASFPNSELPEIRITATWNAQPPISVEPRILFLGKVSPGKVGHGSIRLTATSADALVLRPETEGCSSDLKVSVSQVTETVVDIGVRWIPTGSTGAFRSELELIVEKPEAASIRVPILGVVGTH